MDRLTRMGRPPPPEVSGVAVLEEGPATASAGGRRRPCGKPPACTDTIGVRMFAADGTVSRPDGGYQ